MTASVSSPTVTRADWPTTFRSVLADVLQRGEKVTAGEGLSIGGGRTSRELLNHTYTLAQPHDRLVSGPGIPFNLHAAVGRFVWMMAGDDRLSSIEFYDARARLFSDDGLTVPGSSDGHRLINPRPGLNQLDRVVDLLASEPGTRRAAASIYHPEDAGRVSRDIPCHIAVAYNRRHNALHATTMMRSCNAARVLPYDFFLFSLLAEYVARRIGADPGTYTQFTASMHVYEEDLGTAAEAASSTVEDSQPKMAPMPADDPAACVAGLVRVEEAIRLSVPSADRRWVRRHEAVIADTLPDYWQDFGRVLLMHAIRRSTLADGEKAELSMDVGSRLSAPFRRSVEYA